MAKTTTAEQPVLQLDTLRVESLPELQGWREKQQAIAKENPFIACQDHKSYTEAKKNRTALVSARTDVEKQEKLIASKLSEFRKKVGSISKELIEITKPHEDKQQEEVKRYEAEKEAERQEKERIEAERVKALQDRINSFYETWKTTIQGTDFENIDACKEAIVEALDNYDSFDFAEFQEDFNDKVKLLRELFKDRIQFLTEREEARKEQEKLDAERAAYEAQKAKEEEAREEQHQKTFVIRCNRLEEVGFSANDEMEFVNTDFKLKLESFHDDVYAMDIEEFEDFIQNAKTELANAKAEAKRKAEEEAAAKAKAEAEEKARIAAEEKRIKALAPDKTKLIEFVNSADFFMKVPTLKSDDAKELLKDLQQSLNDWVAGANDRVEHLK